MTERSEVINRHRQADTGAERAIRRHDITTWVGDRLGVRLVDPPGRDGTGFALADLAGLAVRRNPRRAHLVVSTVLGKHLPVDPRLAYAAGRLLGGLAAVALGGASGPNDASGIAAALRGDADELAKCCGPDDPGVPTPEPPLVVGYAETATSLGHTVADAFADARYLHSTRRAVPGFAPAVTFDEAHSHATEHLLLPADPSWLADARPVVLVDDELTTGRTAAATIRALHRLAARKHYVIAVLLDLRTPSEQRTLAELAAELNVRIEVVALAKGEVRLPEDVLRTAQDLVNSVAIGAELPGPDGTRPDGVHPHRSSPPPSRRIDAAWASGLPDGGRHGFAAHRRAGMDTAIGALAAEVTADLPDGRILVLGTEELMYTPLRLALALTGHRSHVDFSSTTRSPVLPIDEVGYAIRTRLRFPSPEPDPAGAPRFAYNVAGAGYDGVVLVVDDAADTPALWGPEGLVETLRPVCGALTVAVVPTVST